MLIIMTIMVTLLSIYFKDYANKPLSLTDEEVQLVVEPGMHFKQITHLLVEAGVVKEILPWQIFGRLSGVSSSIKAGEYTFQANLSPVQLLNKLIKGSTVQFAITVVEGWTFNQMWEEVNKHEKIKQVAKTKQELLELLEIEKHPEGLFYPDTYHFPAGTTNVEFFQRAHEYMEGVLQEEWANRDKDTNLKTADEVLILASIIEKETSVDDERELVAAVFNTRLKRNMRLQTDPTVIYGMGDEYQGNIRRKDLKEDTPYNTYVHKGLPPTPIALPSRASIAAALHPADTEVIFFVSKGDGTHHFSKTYDEHRNAVIKYQLGGKKHKYQADHKSE
jgi:UPF0755 protein